MKKVIAILSLVCSVHGLAFAQDAANRTDVTVASFAFMKGCWEIVMPDLDVRIEEHWMAPAGGTMLGISRSVRSGKTSGWEYMRLEANERGVFFVSKPRENKEETFFRLKEFKEGYAVFENPEHDFPQRVIYRSEKDALSARIEGTQNGKTSGMDFPYKRAKCE